MEQVTNRIAEIKPMANGVSVTATEPVFGYMAAALGFKMENYDFQLAVMNDTEPSFQQTVDFEKCLNEKTVRILFYNSQVTDPTTQRMLELAKKVTYRWLASRRPSQRSTKITLIGCSRNWMP